MSKVSLFLQRWSRLKTQAEKVPAVPGQPADLASPGLPSPSLPSLDSLTPDSDFSGFLHPEVDAETRQAALKKLFMTDHYRTMDMLDVYVDDYSKPELLPAEMLAKLDHAVALLVKPEQANPEPAAAGNTLENPLQPTELSAPADPALTPVEQFSADGAGDKA
ncbi:MAG: DUF3306 domain-containing protein [Methylophilaceae bacterium]